MTKSLTDAARIPREVTRRNFLRTTGAAAAGTAAFASFFTVKDAHAVTTGENAPDPVAPAAGQSVRYRYSVCQNCHARCGIMAKVVGPAGSTNPAAGVLVKLEGNPYHPNNMEEDERLGGSQAPDATTGAPPQGVVGRLCPKGHAGIQVLYDPYRIKHPLKRVGARGSGRWEAIPWSQAFSEIAAKWNALIPTSTRLTADINPSVPELGKAANGVVMAPGRLPDGEMNERIFKNTYGSVSFRQDHTSICEQAHHASNELMTWSGGKKSHFKPDIMNSQYMILFGNSYLEAGFPMVALARKTVEFKKLGRKLVVVDPRFSNTAAKADRWVPAKPGTDGAVALGIASHILKTFGPNPGNPTGGAAPYLRNANQAAANADLETTWTDAALLVVTAPADQAGRYLRYTDVNPDAHTDSNGGLSESGTDTSNWFSAWSLSGINYGINIDRGGVLYVRVVVTAGTAVVSLYKSSGKLQGQKVAEGSGPVGTTVTLNEMYGSGLSGSVAVDAAATGTYEPVVLTITGTRYVRIGGVTTAVGSGAQEGDLLPGDVTVVTNHASGQITYTARTAFQILYDNVIGPYSVEHYADLAGVDAQQLKDIAVEFFAAGRKAIANAYRGTVQHTNGFWNMMGVMLLNALVGNYDWVGGNSAGGGSWAYAYGTMKGTNSSGHPKGVRMDRAEVSPTFYSALNNVYPSAYPYPAKRPWFPYGTHGNFQEVIPGILDQYPTPCKVLITYWNAWPYSTPGLKNVFLTAARDTSKIPLFIAIDNVMGEVSCMADYILPDTTYLEKWAFPGGTPTIMTKFTAFRQPVVGSYDSAAWDAAFSTTAANNYRPIYPDTRMFEDIMIGLMTALGLTNEIGAGTGGANVGPALPANSWAHWKAAVDFLAATVFAATDPGKPALAAATDVGPIIARGGAFQDPGYAYDTAVSGLNYNKLRYRYASEIRLYYELLAWVEDSMGDGPQKLAPLAPVGGGYLAVAHHEPIKDVRGNPVSDSTYPFELITYKKVLHAQARTQNLPWLTVWQPENFIELNASDAGALGLRTYDLARISSASDPVGLVGRVLVTEGLRPGVVAVSHHYGHWQQNAVPWQAAGSPSPNDPTYAPGIQSSDPTRALGIQANPIMRLDPYLLASGATPVSLQDKIGCSCSFNDTRVNVQKV